MRTIKGRFGKHGVIQTQGQTLSDWCSLVGRNARIPWIISTDDGQQRSSIADGHRSLPCADQVRIPAMLTGSSARTWPGERDRPQPWQRQSLRGSQG